MEFKNLNSMKIIYKKIICFLFLILSITNVYSSDNINIDTEQENQLNLEDLVSIRNNIDLISEEYFNDDYFNFQYSLKDTHFPEAYIYYQNNIVNYLFENLDKQKPVIAILSFGFDPKYRDTLNTIYINHNEIPLNYKDDDSNGMVDDYDVIDFENRNFAINYAIDFYNDKDYLLENNPGFLTQLFLSSEIGNNYKYAGLLLDKAIKTLLIDISYQLSNTKTIGFLDAAIQYVLNMKDRGLNIIAVLLAVPETIQISNIKYPLIKALADKRIFFIMPAGSYVADDNKGYKGHNLNKEESHPCFLKGKYEHDMQISLDNFLCVGFLDRKGKLKPDGMSNYGDKNVDLLTSGRFDIEADGNVLYSSMFSSAVIAAAVANAKILYPNYSNEAIKQLIYNSGQKDKVSGAISDTLFRFDYLFEELNNAGIGFNYN
jgi:hypothetical protein